MLFSKQCLPELISLHIPKTAGTSFRNILKSVYGTNEVSRFDINEKGVVRLNELVYSTKTLPSVKVIHGHFSFRDLNNKFELPNDYKLITWMRDPVKRVISNYFYLDSRLKELLDEEKNNLNILSKMKRSLIEYARAEVNRNRQSKFLTGKELTSFDFIGLHEYFDDEVKRLSTVLNWDAIPNILYHNKTSGSNPEIAPEILDEIRILNSDDINLYEQALQIRQNKLST